MHACRVGLPEDRADGAVLPSSIAALEDREQRPPVVRVELALEVIDLRGKLLQLALERLLRRATLDERGPRRELERFTRGDETEPRTW